MKIRVGETFHNLEEVRVVELREPRGWCTIPLYRKIGEDVLDSILDPDVDDDEDDDDNADDKKRKKIPLWKRKPLRTHFVQIGITSMHQVSVFYELHLSLLTLSNHFRLDNCVDFLRMDEIRIYDKSKSLAHARMGL